jgi:hypothetical protein
VSALGQGGALNGFKGFMPTGQSRELGTSDGGGAAMIAGDDSTGDITTVGSGGACVIGSGVGTAPTGEPTDGTVARLVTAPLAVMGEHRSNCAGLSV